MGRQKTWKMHRQALKERRQALQERGAEDEDLALMEQTSDGAQSFLGMLRQEWGNFWKFVDGSLKMKIILVLCALLLIGTVTKIISDRVLYRQMDIVDAFAASDMGCVESRLQITADYGTAFLTEHDKQALLGYLADAIGVRMDAEIESRETEVSQIYSYTKQARQAATTIKAITLREDTSRTYLYVELEIYQDTEYDILNYRDIILDTLKEMGVKQAETTLQLLGAYPGKLPISEWDKLANTMIKNLSGKVIYENRDEELYTIYAYSNLLSEYITVENKKINMQVAMRYEADNDRTVLYLATPIIRGDW